MSCPARECPERVPIQLSRHFAEFPRGSYEAIRKALGPELERFIEHACYVIHRIVTGHANDQWGVPLMAKDLQWFISHDHYSRVLNAIIKAELISRDHRYKVKGWPKGLKLTPRIARTPLTTMRVTNKKLVEKIQIDRDKRLAEWLNSDVEKSLSGPLHRHFFRWLRGIEIAYKAAEDEFDDYKKGHDESQATAILAIHRRAFRLSESPNGRIHHNLTNLGRGFKKYLTYRGRELENLDIRNSQPLVFALVLKEKFPDGLPVDARHYVELCQDGQFYNFMMREMGFPDDGAEAARKEFKQVCFGTIFFCRNSTPLQPTSARFAALFPNVYRVIRKLKAKNHRILARRLQRPESDLMIGTICGRIMKKMPNVFILTIHDSILCLPEHVDSIKGVMMEEFAKKGLRPTINREPLSKPLCPAS